MSFVQENSPASSDRSSKAGSGKKQKSKRNSNSSVSEEETTEMNFAREYSPASSDHSSKAGSSKKQKSKINSNSSVSEEETTEMNFVRDSSPASVIDDVLSEKTPVEEVENALTSEKCELSLKSEKNLDEDVWNAELRSKWKYLSYKALNSFPDGRNIKYNDSNMLDNEDIDHSKCSSSENSDASSSTSISEEETSKLQENSQGLVVNDVLSIKTQAGEDKEALRKDVPESDKSKLFSKYEGNSGEDVWTSELRNKWKFLSNKALNRVTYGQNINYYDSQMLDDNDMDHNKHSHLNSNNSDSSVVGAEHMKHSGCSSINSDPKSELSKKRLSKVEKCEKQETEENNPQDQSENEDVDNENSSEVSDVDFESSVEHNDGNISSGEEVSREQLKESKEREKQLRQSIKGTNQQGNKDVTIEQEDEAENSNNAEASTDSNFNKKKLSLEKHMKRRKEKGIPLLPENVERRIYNIKRRLREKGIPVDMLKDIIRKVRRKEEIKLRDTLTTPRYNQNVKNCFNCRKPGHLFAHCPLREGTSNVGAGICFKCGLKGHSSYKCPNNVIGYPFAHCFICKELGHISRDCPNNKHGVYPDGGKCSLCGNVNHLRKDCPSLKKQEEKLKLITAHTIEEGTSIDAEIMEEEKVMVNHQKPKVVKF